MPVLLERKDQQRNRPAGSAASYPTLMRAGHPGRAIRRVAQTLDQHTYKEILMVVELNN